VLLMPRDFNVPGECLVMVKGGIHTAFYASGRDLSAVTMLGLAKDSISVSPVFKHKDVNADDFGPDVPAEVMAMLAECRVRMLLHHFDRNTLDSCVGESVGNVAPFVPNVGPRDAEAGLLVNAGTLLGGGFPMFSSGNRLISLNLTSPQMEWPWRFRSSYIDAPLLYPMGVEAQQVLVEWRVFPYAPIMSGLTFVSGSSQLMGSPIEISSSGIPLWDRRLDV
jgi:hypothetical protein